MHGNSLPARPRLLLTGFEPFAQFAVNPSWLAAERIAGQFPADVVARCLPVQHHLARERLVQALDELHPQAVLAMGLAAGDEFRIECSARKVVEFVDLEGAPEHPITLDRQIIAATLKRLEAPWRFSDDAGRYVCESTYWALLEHVSLTSPATPCAFLHVPADSVLWPAARTCDVVREVVRDLLGSSLRTER